MKINRKAFLQIIVFFLVGIQAQAENFEVSSPDKRIKLSVMVDQGITWSVSLEDNVVIKTAKIGMDFSTGQDFGVQPKVTDDNIRSVSSVIRPSIPHKDAEIKDKYTALSLTFEGSYSINFRAYNDGVAYQFVDNGKAERNVISEEATLTFPDNTRSFFPKEKSTYSSNERLYLDKALKEISTGEFCSLPVMFATQNAKVVFTETALHDYPAMFLKSNGNGSMSTKFPNFVLEAVDAKKKPDRNQTITKKADYIAKVSGNRDYPWRVFVIGNDDRVFIESNLSYQLAKPVAIKNTSWIKAGKVAWDWYNANNLFDVDFKPGLNTQTYKYYIDFAASNNIEYVILDEGWTKSTTNILDFNPKMDVRELISYAKQKGVGIILWVLWKPLDENLDHILETYKSWGAKGIKVDFIQRSDQYVVNSYERIAKKCAEEELLVNFHGAFKPAGLRRMYPNVINYEAVKGSENNKWSSDITPEHNVTIPFIRMLAGPMDYTPGAMNNRHKKGFSVSFKTPNSLGTRAHQVAMYVVYEAPLQMLCESPSLYMKEQESLDFIRQIPTIWDETKVLKGVVGDYVAIARRKGEKWYIGAMTDWSARKLELDLSFLKGGNYSMEVFKDGDKAATYAEDYKKLTKEVTNSSKLTIEMSTGGGWAAILSKK